MYRYLNNNKRQLNLYDSKTTQNLKIKQDADHNTEEVGSEAVATEMVEHGCEHGQQNHVYVV